MVKDDQELRPYAVPVADTLGTSRIVYVLATPAQMQALASLGAHVLHASQFQEVITVKQQADILRAVHDRDAMLEAGGRLQ